MKKHLVIGIILIIIALLVGCASFLQRSKTKQNSENVVDIEVNQIDKGLIGDEEGELIFIPFDS